MRFWSFIMACCYMSIVLRAPWRFKRSSYLNISFHVLCDVHHIIYCRSGLNEYFIANLYVIIQFNVILDVMAPSLQVLYRPIVWRLFGSPGWCTIFLDASGIFTLRRSIFLLLCTERRQVTVNQYHGLELLRYEAAWMERIFRITCFNQLHSSLDAHDMHANSVVAFTALDNGWVEIIILLLCKNSAVGNNLISTLLRQLFLSCSSLTTIWDFAQWG